MFGLLLFARSIWSVVSNPQRLIRVYTAPLVVGVGFFVLPYLVAGDRWPIMTNLGGGTFFYDPSLVSPWFIPLSWASSTGLFLCLIWAAVSWHRAVLLQPRPGDASWLPQLGSIARYLFGLAVVVGTLWGAWIAVDLVVAFLANSFSLNTDELLPNKVASIAPIAQLWLFLATSPVMVAASIGQAKQIWQLLLTTPSRIFVSLICAACMYGLASGLWWFADEYMPSYISYVLVSRLGTLFLGMIGISLLTTIYGHYVEGRDLT
ncbi:hypothetical protein [Thalassovita mangrovi]|uniref:Uncharacterized protein n=1 Tax=Thalassovita mangrovi TaxID=2692236 RepID=A0A6L8LH25_9RHOB|nr:hypothetical protein [Thalassovita mangrovi]MYM55377.1 hypothetical protein [Thalassovita mangrovi]